MPCLQLIKPNQKNRLIPIITPGCGNFFDVTASALTRAIDKGNEYAFKNAPTSPYINLSGNRYPDNIELKWLKNKNKCNQFVGDVLTDSGYAVPTYIMTDGSEHYKNAEAFPKENQYFSKIQSLDKIQSGDIFVRDYGTRSGDSGAHTEIIIASDIKHNKLTLVGAHTDGAYITDMTFNPKDWTYLSREKCWLKGNDRVYFLRPIKKTESMYN